MMATGPLSCRFDGELLGVACVSVEQFIDGADKVDRAWRCTNAARKDSLVGDIVAVIGLGVVDVLVDDVAVEVDSGEESLVPGVGEEAGIG